MLHSSGVTDVPFLAQLVKGYS